MIHGSSNPASPLDETHDASLETWVESANDAATDFPIQNLPFGRFRSAADAPWRIGVAIGDRVLDLESVGLIDTQDMNRLMARGAAPRRALRLALSRALRRGSEQQGRFEAGLRAQSEVEMGLPCHIGDYTDFYTGIHHATAVGKLFRPDNPLLPNYKWVPIGYHGRASSIGVSGQSFRRPLGQTQGSGETTPVLGPSRRLDYELELAAFVAVPNALGDPISIADAEEHLFGVALFNDWSARDIQAWEYRPLGPFLGKSFATSISAWVTPLLALGDARVALPPQDPAPLPYLAEHPWGLDLALELELNGTVVSRPSARHLYWSPAQMVAHLTANGASLRTGDLLGSGTISGPDEYGSLVELSRNGAEAVELGDGSTRTFLLDGDEVVLRGDGLAQVTGRILPADGSVGAH